MCSLTLSMSLPSSLVAVAALVHSALALSPPLVARQLLEMPSENTALRAERAFAIITLYSDSECTSAGWSTGALNLTHSEVPISATSCRASLDRCVGSATRWLRVRSCSEDSAAFVQGQLSARVGEYPTAACSEDPVRIVDM